MVNTVSNTPLLNIAHDLITFRLNIYKSISNLGLLNLFQTVVDIPSVVINLYNPAYISNTRLELHLYCTFLRDEHCSPIPSYQAQKPALNKLEFYSRDKESDSL